MGVRRAREPPSSKRRSSPKRRVPSPTASRARVVRSRRIPWPAAPFARRNDRNFSRATADRASCSRPSSRSSSCSGRCPSRSWCSWSSASPGPRPTPAFASAGAHPATVLGIVAILTLGVAVYNKGLPVGRGRQRLARHLRLRLVPERRASGRRPRRPRRHGLRLRLDRRHRLLRPALRRTAELRRRPRTRRICSARCC